LKADTIQLNSVEPTYFENTIELCRVDMAFYRQDDFENRHILRIKLNSVEPTHFKNTIELCRADMAFYRQDDFESRQSLKVQSKSVEPTWIFIDRTILKADTV
jgi:hypothetical protein